MHAASWPGPGSIATRTTRPVPSDVISNEPSDAQKAAPAVVHAPSVHRFTAAPR